MPGAAPAGLFDWKGLPLLGSDVCGAAKVAVGQSVGVKGKSVHADPLMGWIRPLICA